MFFFINSLSTFFSSSTLITLNLIDLHVLCKCDCPLTCRCPCPLMSPTFSSWCAQIFSHDDNLVRLHLKEVDKKDWEIIKHSKTVEEVSKLLFLSTQLLTEVLFAFFHFLSISYYSFAFQLLLLFATHSSSVGLFIFISVSSDYEQKYCIYLYKSHSFSQQHLTKS